MSTRSTHLFAANPGQSRACRIDTSKCLVSTPCRFNSKKPGKVWLISIRFRLAFNGVPDHVRVIANRGRKTEHERHDKAHCDSQDDQLSLNGMFDPVLSPGHVGIGQLRFDGRATELIIDETAESDAVAEVLERGDDGVPDGNGGSNKEDVLEHAAEGHDQA